MSESVWVVQHSPYYRYIVGIYTSREHAEAILAKAQFDEWEEPRIVDAIKIANEKRLQMIASGEWDE